MKEGMNLHRARVCFVAGICLFIGTALLTEGHSYAPAPRATRKGNVMTARASGTFEVKLTPRTSEENDGGAGLVRMSIDKQFHGDLTAVSKGEMLANNMGDKGSGGYVAMERVSGTLHGRDGTFVLQHSGTMRQGAAQLSIVVVPGSGTGQLAGLEGQMTIKVADGKHRYEFEYTLAETPKNKAND